MNFEYPLPALQARKGFFYTSERFNEVQA